MRIRSVFLFSLVFSHPIWAQPLKFVTQEAPPFNYLDKQTVAGPAADVIRATCAQAQLTCEFQLLPWSRAQNLVKKGRAHGMFVIGWNKPRAEWLHYSKPLLISEYGFFAHQDSDFRYAAIEDLQQQKVGVYGPSNTSNSLNKLQAQLPAEQGMRIFMQPDDVQVFKMLNAGSRGLNLVFSNRDIGNANIRAHNLGQLKYVGAVRSVTYYIGFSKAHTPPDLLQRFNSTYDQLEAQGRVRQLIETYQMQAAVN